MCLWLLRAGLDLLSFFFLSSLCMAMRIAGERSKKEQEGHPIADELVVVLVVSEETNGRNGSMSELYQRSFEASERLFFSKEIYLLVIIFL